MCRKPSVWCSRSSANSAAHGRCSSGSARRRSRCPSSGGTSTSQDRLEGAGLPRRHADPAQPAVRGSLCVRQDGAADADRRRARLQGQRHQEAGAGVGGPAARQSRRLHHVAGLRGEPEALAGERLHEAQLRSQIGARRSRSADWPHALRAMRPDDARVLRHGKRPRASLPMPRRRRTRGRRLVHRRWRRSGRSRHRPATARSRLRPRRRSRHLRFGSDRALDERRHRRGGARPRSGALRGEPRGASARTGRPRQALRRARAGGALERRFGEESPRSSAASRTCVRPPPLARRSIAPP